MATRMSRSYARTGSRSYRSAYSTSSSSNGPKLILAKRESFCKTCGFAVLVGDAIFWTPGSYEVEHGSPELCQLGGSTRAAKPVSVRSDDALERPYASKFGGVCNQCKGKFQIGEPIFWHSIERTVRHQQCPERPELPVAAAPSVIPDGKFTLVVGSGPSQAHVTFRVRTAKRGRNAGTTFVGIRGSRDLYTEFAVADGAALKKLPQVFEAKAWGQPQGPLVAQAEVDNWMLIASVLFEGGDYYLEAGQIYAKQAQECWRCSRDLTDPVSIDLGIGPDCRKQVSDSHGVVFRAPVLA